MPHDKCNLYEEVVIDYSLISSFVLLSDNPLEEK